MPEARAGICGNHAAIALEMFNKAGFEARYVEFYYQDDVRLSHIIPEVLIDGAWRAIDKTYGAYWIYNSAIGHFRS